MSVVEIFSHLIFHHTCGLCSAIRLRTEALSLGNYYYRYITSIETLVPNLEENLTSKFSLMDVLSKVA